MAQNVLMTNTLGGYFTVPHLTKKLWEAVQPLLRWRQYVSIKEAFGKGRGQSVLFDRVSNISTAGGTLVETATIPRHNIVIGQGTMTVTEWGNAIGNTLKLNLLSEFSVDNATHRALRNDMVKVLDNAVATQFLDTVAKYVCLTSTSGTLTTATTGTAGGTAVSNLNRFHVRAITDQLDKWNVERFDDGDFVCISSINAISGIKDETTAGGWIDASRYAGSKRLWKGEVGEYLGVRFVQENHCLSNAIGTGGVYGEAAFFGRDTVMEAIALPEEIRADTPQDFGRSLAVAWLAILGFKIIWTSVTDSFAVDVAKGWVPRIIHVTSQGEEGEGLD